MQFYLKCVYVRHLKMIECQYLALQEQRSGRCGIQYKQPLDKGCGQMCQKQVLCQKHEIFGTLSIHSAQIQVANLCILSIDIPLTKMRRPC